MYGRMRGGIGHAREEESERWVSEGMSNESIDGMCCRYCSL